MPFYRSKHHLAESLHKPSIIPTRFSLLTSNSFLADGFLIFLFIGLSLGFFTYIKQVIHPLETTFAIELSPFHLVKYTFFSLSRGIVTYLISLVFSIIYGSFAAKDKVSEKILIPLLDILQSIPVLGFMPGLVILLIGVFPYSNKGLELASILMIVTGQTWNMAFGVYHSMRTVPIDKLECAKSYQLTRWQIFRLVKLPCATISLVWNSIMSMAGGWFFLMISEAFQLGKKDFRLPGLGSYMSVAASEGNLTAMLWAIFAMILLILFLDQFLWKPLIIWSQKFRVEDVSSQELFYSWFLNILKNSWILSQIHLQLKKISILFKYATPWFHEKRKLSFDLNHFMNRLCLITLLLLLGIGLSFLVKTLYVIPSKKWFNLSYLTLLTFLRVSCCLALGVIIAIPLGLFIGTSRRYSQYLQSLIQITASFPATLLFPILIWIFKLTGMPLEISSIILMLTGTLWYVLFNVIAGAKAIPEDLNEVATSFRLPKLQKLLKLNLPVIFPYLITGVVTGSGGAWNASIVAEYLSYNGHISTVPGIGSSISLAAQKGDIPLLLASLTLMVIVVVSINYIVWLKLYHYSEKQFALNY